MTQYSRDILVKCGKFKNIYIFYIIDYPQPTGFSIDSSVDGTHWDIKYKHYSYEYSCSTC